MFLDKINGLISYLDSPSLTGFYKEQKRIYSISSDLSAVSAPDGTGRHWGQATPAPTGPDRHRPIQTGAGPGKNLEKKRYLDLRHLFHRFFKQNF